MADYPRIDVTVDVVALTEVDGAPHALVVRRGNPPFEGQWALPGGYLEVDEDLADGAARELQEETGVTVPPEELRQLGAYGAPGRDPRNRTISVAFVVELDREADAAGGSDAAEAAWQPLEALWASDLAFDHETILRDGVAASRWAASLPSAHADPG
ncbi:MAG: NUDIX hydrolase [Marmoricola sp.]